MKIYVRVMSVVLVLLQMLTLPVLADSLRDYEAARSYYLASGACMSVYGSRSGHLATRALEQEGWQIQSFVESDEKAVARFLMAYKPQPRPGDFSYLVAVAGTENLKDVKVDLRTRKVYFAGKTLEEFDSYAKQKDVPATEPKVHQGFHEYVQTMISVRQQDTGGEKGRLMVEHLASDPSLRILMVGHSLGGAAVTLAAARLISMGVQPDQISVITFGAPAVGNEAFRQQFEGKFDLTRVVMGGDEIPIALQRTVGGYKQFGREVQWKKPAAVATFHPHDIVVYLDVAAKMYYETRAEMVRMGALQLDPPDVQPQLCVTPVRNGLPTGLKDEYPAMREALLDEYRRLQPIFLLEDSGLSSPDEIYRQAGNAGCHWLVTAEIDGERIRGSEGLFQVSLQHALYRVFDRHAMQVGAFGSSTKSMSPLQALMHGARLMSRDSGVWSGRE